MAQKDRASELLSMDRAARIILPQCGGHIDLAKEHIRTAIKQGRIDPRSSRPSPDNADTRFHRQDSPHGWWFEHDNETALIKGILSLRVHDQEFEVRRQWADYLNKGGLIFVRSEIQSLIAPSSGEQADNTKVNKTEYLLSYWNFAQALAWVATRNFAQVALIDCNRNWALMPQYDERISGAMHVFQKAGQKRALGRLIHFVSMNKCKCDATLTDDNEAWETCHCTTKAFDALLDAFKSGKLVAYDEVAAEPISNELLPAFQLDPVRFELRVPSVAGSITLRKTDVINQFPPINDNRASPVSDKALKAWFSKIPDPESMSIDAKLYPMAQSVFPNNLVSRERVRKLAGAKSGNRKPGPKDHSATK